jgi:hypothetical protein
LFWAIFEPLHTVRVVSGLQWAILSFCRIDFCQICAIDMDYLCLFRLFRIFLGLLGLIRTVVGRFGPFQSVPDSSRLFQTIMDHLGPFWAVMDCFGLLQTVSGYFRPTWIITGLFRLFWADLDHF